MDLDTFLTTLHVHIDDWYKREMSALMERHAGPALQLSDSALLTIAIAAQWTIGVPWHSERGIRSVHAEAWSVIVSKDAQTQSI